MFLRAGGYEAIDLGRDVPTEKVVEAVKKYHPLFMTGTALMTTTMTAFPKVVDALEKEGLEVPAIGCGGGAVRKDYVESMPMTVYGVEAYHTPKLADAILKNHKTWEDLRKESNCGKLKKQSYNVDKYFLSKRLQRFDGEKREKE